MNYSEKDTTESEHEPILVVSNIKSLFTYLHKKWLIFIIVGLLGGLAGYFYAAMQKPMYKSKLTFALDEGGSGGNVGGLAGLASQFGLNIGGGKDIFAGENIIEIMKSRRMVERVLLSSDTFTGNKPETLIEYYLQISGKRKSNRSLVSVHFPVSDSRNSLNYTEDSVLKKVYKELISDFLKAAKPDRKLNIFEVNVTSANEKFSKVFTERIVQETNQFYVEIRTKKASKTLEALENRVAAMKGNLNVSISSRASQQDANVNSVFASAQVPVLKQQANIQAFSGAYGEMFKNLEIARFQYLNDIPLLQIIDAPDYPLEKIKTGKLVSAVVVAIFFNLLLMLALFFRWFLKEGK
ncbi:MAG: Wzz/FepE/Etk N-terminal domain-containing protein [Ferruginibacter sp.]